MSPRHILKARRSGCVGTPLHEYSLYSGGELRKLEVVLSMALAPGRYYPDLRGIIVAMGPWRRAAGPLGYWLVAIGRGGQSWCWENLELSNVPSFVWE